MNPADALKASCLRGTGTFVWNFRCSAELLGLSLAGEQKFQPLSSFSVAYIVLAKSQLRWRKLQFVPSNKESPMPGTAMSSSFLSCWVVGLIFVGFCFCCFVQGSFKQFKQMQKPHLYLHLNRGCNQSIASMLAGDSLFFLPNVLQTSWFHLFCCFFFLCFHIWHLQSLVLGVTVFLFLPSFAPVKSCPDCCVCFRQAAKWGWH